MPELAKRRVGSSWGTVDDEGMCECLSWVKYEMKVSRTRVTGHGVLSPFVDVDDIVLLMGVLLMGVVVC
jgi:hypothetical protein